jgi:hypothetical protein
MARTNEKRFGRVVRQGQRGHTTTGNAVSAAGLRQETQLTLLGDKKPILEYLRRVNEFTSDKS